MESTEQSCECGNRIIKQGESVAVDILIADFLGHPIENLREYTIGVSIRTRYAIALVFIAGDSESSIKSEIDENGSLAFILDAKTTSALLPEEYFLEIRLESDKSAVESNLQYVFTLMESDLTDISGDTPEISPHIQLTKTIPSLRWREQQGWLYVKPNVSMGDPILRDCYVGILHYKNAQNRRRFVEAINTKLCRPDMRGFRVVNDESSGNIGWTTVRLIPQMLNQLSMDSTGWFRVVYKGDLFKRYVERIANKGFCNNTEYRLHRGVGVSMKNFGKDNQGYWKQSVSFFSGVVLYIPIDNSGGRIEGPRSYFRIMESNYGQNLHIGHI